MTDESGPTEGEMPPADAAAPYAAVLARFPLLNDLGIAVYGSLFPFFLETPLHVFEGQRPLDLLAQGRADDVLALLAADYEGSVS